MCLSKPPQIVDTFPFSALFSNPVSSFADKQIAEAVVCVSVDLVVNLC